MLSTIWEQFLSIVREEAGSRVVETWLKAVSLYDWNALDKKVHILAPNTFVKEWIKANYSEVFNVHLRRLLNVDQLTLVFIDNAQSSDVVSASAPKMIIPAQRADLVKEKNSGKKNFLTKYNGAKYRHSLNKNYKFETFVKGPNNQMAYAAAVAITKRLGKLYNPLFIYGPSGLGKTHLLHAIANELLHSDSDINILYQPADRFVTEFINAIRFDKMPAFQEKYKSIDVFLVDDIQSICNKEQTQEAFFHIFNAMYDAHKQIVFSSDCYPAAMEGLAERLRSRLAWGLVADVQTPSVETKIAIIKQKGDLHGQVITDEVAEFIAEQVTTNIRELEGMLIRVTAYASISKQPITLELAKKIMVISDKKAEAAGIDFDGIIKHVSKHYSYTLSDLRSKNRSKQLSCVRQIAMYFMKKFTNKSLQEIAAYLHRQDHSTVIHAFKQIEQKIKQDQIFGRELGFVEQKLQQ